ncbi:hypothetical protein OCA16_26065 [Bacillus cereus]|nr:hypothetical protein [Bacillus cereus]
MGLLAYLIAFLIGAVFVGTLFLAVVKLDWFIFGIIGVGVVILCFAIGIPIANSFGITP